MAKQYEGFDVPFTAKDDMSSKQYYFVQVDGTTDDQVDVCSAITDVILGITQTTGTTGAGVSVRVTGHSQLTMGESVNAGSLIGTDTSGRGVAITAGSDTTQYVAARCVKGADTNELGEVVLTLGGRAA
jgi:phenylacetate-coenzyme A ligase PaaK-like adenylate-forming protein